MSVKLNIGCGTNPVAGWLNIDVSRAIRHVDFIRASATAIPLASASAECAVMLNVLDYLDTADRKAALDEAYRVLEPGGVLRVSVLDLRKLVSAYTGGTLATFDSATQAGDYETLLAADQLGRHAFESGRCALFDDLALQAALRRAGFVNPFVQRVGESLSESIRLVIRDRSPAVSIIVEAQKW